MAAIKTESTHFVRIEIFQTVSRTNLSYKNLTKVIKRKCVFNCITLYFQLFGDFHYDENDNDSFFPIS